MLPVVQVAAEAGVKHIVYPGAADVEGLDFALLSSHTRVYDAIVQAGIQATHLRHNIYAEVVAGEVAGAIAAGELAAPVNGAPIAPVLRSDLAPAIAAVLTEGGHEGKVYDLTGHDAVSWAQLAQLASERAGKPIPYRSISEAEAKARLQAAGLPEAYIPSLLGFYAAYRAGWSGTPTGTSSSSRPAGHAIPRRDRRGTRRDGEVGVELGIISLSDLRADPHTRPVAALDRLDATLTHARAADELGLDVFTLGEHHSHKFAVASPAGVRAGAAARGGHPVDAAALARVRRADMLAAGAREVMVLSAAHDAAREALLGGRSIPRQVEEAPAGQAQPKMRPRGGASVPPRQAM